VKRKARTRMIDDLLDLLSLLELLLRMRRTW
jgi:hypothetical protein